MNHGSLFSGIGGFDLASKWMGWTNAFHCEWEDFPRKVLQYHFPESKSYGDINETDFTIWNGKIDILTGGFPCQPYSGAGKRLGTDDERHLWPQMLRAIREIEPRWVIGENVHGITTWNEGLVFEEVQADLENEGYKVQAYVLPACAVGAPHRRDRVWFVAHTNGGRHRWRHEPSKANKQEEWQVGKDVRQHRDSVRGKDEGRGSASANTINKGLQGRKNEGGVREVWQERNKQLARCIQSTWQDFPTQPPVCGGDDGVPRELDTITFSKWRKESIKAYGNAIVPQVALQLFKTIEQYEKR